MIPGMSHEKHFAEFFAGIGLVRESLEPGGWKCIYANDIDPKKAEMYATRFADSSEYDLGDVWQADRVLEKLQPAIHLATASFPCTDMSLAGKMKGFGGEQSSTFFAFTKILQQLGDDKPPFVLLENVPGFLRSNNGADFQAAAETLAGLGYFLDAFQIDAAWFLPQSRPRLFLVGFHKSIVGPPLVIRNDDQLFQNQWRDSVDRQAKMRPARLREAIDSIELSTGWATVPCEAPTQQSYRLIDFIDLGEEQEWWEDDMVTKHHDMMSGNHRAMVDAWIQQSDITVATVFRRIRKGEQRAEVRSDGIAGCLRTPRGGSARQIVLAAGNGKLRIRWMSPREYARLQGAPDFPIECRPNQAMFGFGDAVCTPVLRWIDDQILTPVFQLLGDVSSGV